MRLARTSSFFFFVAAATASCKQDSTPRGQSITKQDKAPGANAPIATIWVSKSGAIELNGQSVDLDVLGKELEDLAKRKAVVHYGREAAAEERSLRRGHRAAVDRLLPREQRGEKSA